MAEDRKQIAARSIAALEGLKRQAEVNDLSVLADLIDAALAEARDSKACD